MQYFSKNKWSLIIIFNQNFLLKLIFKVHLDH